MKLIVVLQNIRSTYNVGAILRTAEGFGAEEVILAGYTPATTYTTGTEALPHILEKTTKQIAKTALGAEKLVKCVWSKDILTTLEALKERGYIVCGLENNLKNKSLYRLSDWRMAVEEARRARGGLDTQEETKLVLVLGEEVEGINDSLFGVIDCFLEIPMSGKKESFNVSVAAGIALYELLGK